MEIIVLASGSPRRKELLAKTGLKFSVVVSGGEEKAETSDPAETVEKLSLDKASEVADLLQAEKEPQLIIGADTVVACDGEILGKPSDREDAFRMLWKLQGQTHQVYTGVTLLLKKKHTWQAHTFSEKTDVQFYPVSREELLAYIETGEPMDKAGSYGIQGGFGIYVKGICGDYNNVVGLPVGRLVYELKKLGIDIRGIKK
ncbi:Maf family protein [Blautia segnis]|uniref:dTTP/UTP pyrophosphatase n=1 Tax=Blautia segnis TaxID=2763030 RepID=A0A8I0DPK7_9FIRM|nr:Maf family protein [Blautia segnis]MBC5651739.1 septum formation inhibitor Maf [Blautia segnis]